MGVGGPYTWYTGSITLTSGKQKYDLWTPLSGFLSGANASKDIIIRKIHHYEPTAAYRFFDTTSVLNYLNNNFGLQSYTPETIFYLLPIWEDVLRGTQLQLNQRVRRSNFSFDLKGYELTLYPAPTGDATLYFEYTFSADPLGDDIRGHKSKGVTSNVSNIAFGHIGYSSINSIGKTWIWRMTLALCKETLGIIRSKYTSLPLLGEDITLNGPDLVNQGREEQANLRLELQDILEKMSYSSLLEEKINMQKMAADQFKLVPTLIFISK